MSDRFHVLVIGVIYDLFQVLSLPPKAYLPKGAPKISATYKTTAIAKNKIPESLDLKGGFGAIRAF